MTTTMSIDVHQCFRCELRFTNLIELRDHLDRDHPAPSAEPGAVDAPSGTVWVAASPLDLPGAAPAAASLAAQGGMALQLVAVDEPGLSDVTHDAQLRRAAREAWAAGAAAVSTSRLPRQPGLDVTAALLSHLRAARPTLAAMGTHGRTAVGELVFGSVSAAVITASPVPVLLARPGLRTVDHYDRVVCCVDGSAGSDAALGPAADLASRLSVPLWIVEVIASDALPADLVETADVERKATSLRSRLPDVAFDVLHGRPGDAIVEFAGNGGTILVMGRHGRSAARRLVVGSVTQHVVRHAAVPVLVVPLSGQPDD